MSLPNFGIVTLRPNFIIVNNFKNEEYKSKRQQVLTTCVRETDGSYYYHLLMPPTEELSLCMGVSNEIEVKTIATDEATITVVFSIKYENVSQCNDGKETC